MLVVVYFAILVSREPHLSDANGGNAMEDWMATSFWSPTRRTTLKVCVAMELQARV